MCHTLLLGAAYMTEPAGPRAMAVTGDVTVFTDESLGSNSTMLFALMKLFNYKMSVIEEMEYWTFSNTK